MLEMCQSKLRMIDHLNIFDILQLSSCVSVQKSTFRQIHTYMKLVMKIFELGKVYKPSQPASAELLLLFWKELNHCHVSVVLCDNHGDLKKYRRPIDFPQSIMTKQKLVNIEYILKYIWTLLTHLRFVKHKPPVSLLGLKMVIR